MISKELLLGTVILLSMLIGFFTAIIGNLIIEWIELLKKRKEKE